MNKFTCPCCGYKTLECNRQYDICPICYWEDDPYQFDEPYYNDGGANHISLIQAQINYKKFGACDSLYLGKVRKPNQNDLIDLDWSPHLKLNEECWTYLNDKNEFYTRELFGEISKNHILFNVAVTEIAKREDRDDVLFMLLDGTSRFAVVHLTWRGNIEENPNFPATRIYNNANEIIMSENIL